MVAHTKEEIIDHGPTCIAGEPSARYCTINAMKLKNVVRGFPAPLFAKKLHKKTKFIILASGDQTIMFDSTVFFVMGNGVIGSVAVVSLSSSSRKILHSISDRAT